MGKYQVVMNADQCVGCGRCEKVCVAHNIVIKNKKASTLSEDCVMCGHCGAVCPKKAILIRGFDPGQVEKKAEVGLKPEDVLDVIRFRRTIRKFKNRQVPKEASQQILEAGRLTHTAGNAQGVSFVVLDQEKNAMEAIAVNLFRRIRPFAALFLPMARNRTIDPNFFFFHAPLVIVILAKDKTNGILAAQNMEFVAEAHGLGVLFSGFFTMAANHSPKLKRALKVPKTKQVAMTLVLGYPDVTFLRSAQRRPLDTAYR